MKKTTTTNNNIVTEVYEATNQKEVRSLTKLMLANEYSITKFNAYSSDFACYDMFSTHCPMFYGDGAYQVEVSDDFGRLRGAYTYSDIVDLLNIIDGNYDCLKVEIAYAVENSEVTNNNFKTEENKMIKEMSKKMVKVYGLQDSVIAEDNGVCTVEVTVRPVARVAKNMPAILTTSVESEGTTNLKYDYAEPVVVTKRNYKRQVSKVYHYVGDSAVLADYATRNKLNAEMFQPMVKLSQSQNLILIGEWSEVRTMVTKRLAFQSYRRNYSCYWLDAKAHMHAVDDKLVAQQTQLANKKVTRTSDVRLSCIETSSKGRHYILNDDIAELLNWIRVYARIHHIDKTPECLYQMMFGTDARRQNTIDKINAYISEVAPNYDRYTAGTATYADKHNYYKSVSSHQNENGNEYCSTADRTKVVYTTGIVDLFKDYITIKTCEVAGISTDDSVGNSGRVTRECIESGVITYSELAEMINASEDRDYYIELIQNGASIEDVASFFNLTVEESAPSEYREF